MTVSMRETGRKRSPAAASERSCNDGVFVNDVGGFRTGICSQKIFALCDTRSLADVNEAGVASPGK